jgi:hypothetical protein
MRDIQTYEDMLHIVTHPTEPLHPQ